MAESHKSPDDREEENKARPLTEAERSYLAHLSETEGEPLPKRLKEKLEKAILERADATSRSKSLECSLQIAQDELKRFEEQNEQHKQEIQQLVQSLDEQRSVLSELEIKLRV